MFIKLILGSLMLFLFLSMLNAALEGVNEDKGNEVINTVQYVLIFICNLSISIFIVFGIISFLVN